MLAVTSGILIASLIGSAHCAGMCGGLVTLACAPDPQHAAARSPAWLAPTLYNVGRGLAYTTLGAAAGLIGQSADLGGSWLGLQHAAAITAGAILLAFGLLQLAIALGLQPTTNPTIEPLRRLAVAAHQRAFRFHPAARAAITGLLTPLLPCGWLYAFVTAAAGTGSPAAGAATMALFWLGTLPVMAALGFGVHRLLGPLARHLPVASAVIVLGMGVYAVTSRLLPHACCDHAAAPDSSAHDTCDCSAPAEAPAPSHPAEHAP